MKLSSILAVLLCICAPMLYAELPLPAIPSDLRTPALRADYLGKHFWDAMDFADSSALDEREMAQNVANFLSIFPVMTSDSTRREAASALSRQAAQAEASAALVSQTLENYLFAFSSPMRDERLYTIFLEEMIAAGFPDSVRSQWMLGMFAKNSEGSKAGDFRFVNREGKQHKLYDYLGKPVILFFYDPECDLCHATAEKMALDAKLSALVSDGSARIIAIAPGDIESWKESTSVFPETWVDGCDDEDIDDNELYLIPEFPALYLLAPDGTVLRRNSSLSEIIQKLFSL